MSRTTKSSPDPDDPYNLARFVEKQLSYHKTAMQELGAGRKCSCWSWYVLPTPPFIRNGRRCGSWQNQIYELADDDECRAYLAWGGPNHPGKHIVTDLRANYLAIMNVSAAKLEAGVAARRLVGGDAPRLKASAAYFGKIAAESGDAELAAAALRVVELMDNPPQRAQKGKDGAAVGGAGGTGGADGRGQPSPVLAMLTVGGGDDGEGKVGNQGNEEKQQRETSSAYCPPLLSSQTSTGSVVSADGARADSNTSSVVSAEDARDAANDDTDSADAWGP